MFKRLLLAGLILVGGVNLVLADDTVTTTETTDVATALSEAGVAVKQAVAYTYEDNETHNLTAFTIAKTRKVDSWGKWNAVWEGWTIDPGFAYESTTVKDVAVMLGREFGTIGNYLPIDSPLDDILKITLYPFGIYCKDVFENTRDFEVTGGAAYIEGTIKF